MPQLNPIFFASQIFWLVITFVFLFIFLWRISLPRISATLDKRENKISEDLRNAKKFQTEAEQIQKNIDKKLNEAKTETDGLIKLSSKKLNDNALKKLEDLDMQLDLKIEESTKTIQKNKDDSIKEINNEIYGITKMTLSKISNLNISESEIKAEVDGINNKDLN